MTLNEIVAADAPARESFLAALVRMASDNPPGDCAAHAELAAGLLEGLGFSVERHPVSASLATAHGMVSATNLIVRQRFGDGPVVALNAHGDVVPPGEGWSVDPYGAVVVDGWMVGRGVAVSKSDICSYAFAMKALRESGAQLAGTVELHVTYDEETGGDIGPALLLKEGLTKPDYAIAAGFSYAVVTSHNGCLHLEVTVSGRSAHAAKPETGVDALAAATDVLVALYAERDTARSPVKMPAAMSAALKSSPSQPPPSIQPATLGRIPLFSELARSSFESVVRKFARVTVAAGATIIEEGEPGDALFAIATGVVRVERRVPGAARYDRRMQSHRLP